MIHRPSLSPTLLSALALAGSVAGCASPPPHNAAIEQERARLAQLEQDPAIHQNASPTLVQAEQSLASADAAQKTNDVQELDHQIFMASREMSIAQAQADAAQAHTQTAQLSQRNQVMRETERGIVVSLYGLPFAQGRVALQPGTGTRLQPLVNYLKQYPDRQVIVEGNTDTTGTPEVNQIISQQRAEAVRAYLVSAGIPGRQIVARGLGSAFPVASNNTEIGREQNRRVDVVIEPARSAAALPPGPPGQAGGPPSTGVE